MTLAATYLGANGWYLEFDDLRVLVDPWLEGPLTFPPGPWFLQGTLTNQQPLPERLDLLLLSQGLPDHTHPPTLQHLSRSLPVVGSPAAARIVKTMGFKNITGLKPGERHVQQGLTIDATAGAPVPAVENGYLLKHEAGRLYLEPHGYLDSGVPSQQLDAVITPMLDLGLPMAGAFVRGCSVVPQLVDRFHPRTVLASTSGGEVKFEGVLSRFLTMQGSIEQTAEKLPEGTRCIDSQPGERYCLETG